MSDKYILRSGAIDVIKRNSGTLYTREAEFLLRKVIFLLKNAPAADVAPVVRGSGKARATEEAETTQIIDGCCTACGALMDCCEAADYKFCPHCGKRLMTLD